MSSRLPSGHTLQILTGIASRHSPHAGQRIEIGLEVVKIVFRVTQDARGSGLSRG